MTIDVFIYNYGLKRKDTVISWIKNGLIPCANLEKDYVPDSARPPYTKARAKKAGAIYVSIVKASCNRQHVLPKLYRMGDDEFNGYIDRLVSAGLIVKRISDGITYYDATIESSKLSEAFILKAIEAVAKGITGAVATAAINSLR